MDVLTCLIAVAVMGYGTYWIVKWFFKLGTRNAKINNPLNPNDLKVLEETTKRLMDDLRNVTQECVDRIETACEEAEKRIAVAQSGGSENFKSMLDASVQNDVNTVKSMLNESESVTNDLQPGAQTVSSFAKSTGMTTGEVQLMRGLREYNKNKES